MTEQFKTTDRNPEGGLRVRGKQFDVRTGDVFVANKTGAKLFITSVSRGDAFYQNEAGERGMVMVEKLFAFCTKA